MLFGASINEAFNIKSEDSIETYQNYQESSNTQQEIVDIDNATAAAATEEAAAAPVAPVTPVTPATPVSFAPIADKNEDTVNLYNYTNESEVKERNLSDLIDTKIKEANRRIEEQISRLSLRLDSLTELINNNQGNKVDLFGKNIHDILLFIIFGVFIILLMDVMYKLMKLKLK